MDDTERNDNKTIPLDELRTEFINSDSASLKSLAIKYSVPYPVVLKTARDEDWRGQKKTAANNTINNGQVNGAITNGTMNLPKMGEPPEASESASEKEELAELRRQAYKLAISAARALHLKEDWNPKDFDLLVGTYVKVVGAQVKVAGGEDGIDRIIGELTETDVFLSPSEYFKEASDES